MRARLTASRRHVAVAAGVVAVFAMGAAAYAAIPNADGNIYACYNNSNGALRVQHDPAEPCAKGWSPLKWAAGQPDVPVTTIYWKRTVVDMDPNAFEEVTAKCDEGDVATGGGFSGPTGGPAIGTFTAAASHPDPAAGPGATDPPTGWRALLENTGTIARSAAVYVVCAHTE